MDELTSVRGVDNKGCVAARVYLEDKIGMGIGVISSKSYDAAEVFLSTADVRVFARELMRLADVADEKRKPELSALIGA